MESFVLNKCHIVTPHAITPSDMNRFSFYEFVNLCAEIKWKILNKKNFKTKSLSASQWCSSSFTLDDDRHFALFIWTATLESEINKKIC